MKEPTKPSPHQFPSSGEWLEVPTWPGAPPWRPFTEVVPSLWLQVYIWPQTPQLPSVFLARWRLGSDPTHHLLCYVPHGLHEAWPFLIPRVLKREIRHNASTAALSHLLCACGGSLAPPREIHHACFTLLRASAHCMICLHLVCQHLSKVASRAVGAFCICLLRTYQEIDSAWCAHMGKELKQVNS